MGKILHIDNKMQVRVAGIYADIPHHSAFDNTMFVASWDLLMANDKGLQDVKNTWDWDATELYVEIAEGATMEKVSQAIAASTMNHLTGAQRAYAPRVFVHPMDRTITCLPDPWTVEAPCSHVAAADREPLVCTGPK